jgi:hypothetical protein
MSMDEAFRAAPADLGDAIVARRTVTVDFAAPTAPGPNLNAGITRLILANSVYTSVVAWAMLVAETLAGADRFARSQTADGFVAAIGVLPALGGLAVALQTGGSFGTIRMIETGCELAVRISAEILAWTLRALRAVPKTLTVEARRTFRTRKVASFRPLTAAVDTSFALGAL